MFPYQKLKFTNRSSIVFVIVAAPLLSILASLWPLEPIILAMACIVLSLAILATLPFVRSLRLLFAGITTLAVLLSVMTSNWPIRAAFALTRKSFDQMAAQVLAGTPPQTPCRIGLFRIEKAEIYHNGVARLWTDDDSGGSTGFVKYGNDDLPFNLWSHLRPDDSWHLIRED